MWEIYDELISVVPADLRVSDCLIGMHWTLIRSNSVGMALTPFGAPRIYGPKGASVASGIGERISGMPVRELAQYVKSWNPYEASLGLAAINSVLNSPEQVEKMYGRPLSTQGQVSAFVHYAELLRGKTVAVVGRFPDLDTLTGVCQLTVLERSPGPEDLPDPACEFVLPEQDYVFITATTITNKTMPRLLQLSRNASVFLVGPQHSLLAFAVQPRDRHSCRHSCPRSGVSLACSPGRRRPRRFRSRSADGQGQLRRLGGGTIKWFQVPKKQFQVPRSRFQGAVTWRYVGLGTWNVELGTVLGEILKNPKIIRGLIIVGILLAGASGQFRPAFGGGKSRTFTDMMGRKVTVPDPLSRVALLGGPTGQVAYILGARGQLCAITKSLKSSELVNLMDPSVKDLVAPRSVSGQVNVEELIVADPQLVIAGDLDGSLVERKTRIPVAYLKSDMNQSAEMLKQEVRFYGMVFGKQERAEKYIRYLQKTIDLVQSRTKDIPKNRRKLVFNGYSANHLVTLGGDTFMQRQIELAGCRNAAETILTSGTREGGLHTGLAEVSMEKVLGWNPDILVIDFGKANDVCNDPKWKSITAVRNKAVYTQPIGVFIWDRPTAESAVLHPLWLAKTAYPDRFADINMGQEIKRFYREIMSFNLTDEQADAVLMARYTLNIMSGKADRKAGQ